MQEPPNEANGQNGTTSAAISLYITMDGAKAADNPGDRADFHSADSVGQRSRGSRRPTGDGQRCRDGPSGRRNVGRARPPARRLACHMPARGRCEWLAEEGGAGARCQRRAAPPSWSGRHPGSGTQRRETLGAAAERAWQKSGK